VVIGFIVFFFGAQDFLTRSVVEELIRAKNYRELQDEVRRKVFGDERGYQ
jgi:hypothetical protein